MDEEAAPCAVADLGRSRRRVDDVREEHRQHLAVRTAQGVHASDDSCPPFHDFGAGPASAKGGPSKVCGPPRCPRTDFADTLLCMTKTAGTKKISAVIVAALLTAAATPLAGWAHSPHVPVGSPPAGGYSSNNLQWLKHVAVGSVGAPDAPSVFAEGAQRVGDYLYVTENSQGLVIFDIKDAENPVRVGSFSLPVEGAVTAAHVQENERVPTNGKVLLLSQLGDAQYAADNKVARVSRLHVLDVTDKRNPKLRATLSGLGDHTWTCLLDCAWAYSTHGMVLDLRNADAPRVSPVNWFAEVLAQYSGDDPIAGLYGAHHVSEVAPGRVLTAGVPMWFIDARDPETPTLLAHSDPADPAPTHNVDWPRNATDNFIIGINEPGNPGYPRCETRDAFNDAFGADVGVSTWDATTWRKTRRFRHLESYYVRNGTYDDGDPAVGIGVTANMGCGAHFFGIHPTFHNGGLIAEASYAHGLKLLEIDSRGHMTEVGYFLAHGANAADAIWVTGKLLYVFDYQRGIDILRYVDE